MKARSREAEKAWRKGVKAGYLANKVWAPNSLWLGIDVGSWQKRRCTLTTYDYRPYKEVFRAYIKAAYYNESWLRYLRSESAKLRFLEFKQTIREKQIL